MKYRILNILVIALMLLGVLPAQAAPFNSEPQAPPQPPVKALDPRTEMALSGVDTGHVKQEAVPAPLAAGIQAVSTGYTWSQSSGTYTEITGGTVQCLPSFGNSYCDDVNINNVAIGFTFTYNGADYTAVGLDTNGFVRMGGAAFSGNCSYTPISSSDTTNCVNLVSGLGDDQQGNTTGAELRTETLGASPNRVFVIQYKNWRHYGETGESYNYQIRLYETSNLVEVVYGPFTKNTTPRTDQIGLKGASNADFNNRSGTGSWLSSVAGTLKTATMALTSVYYPPSGLTWDWTSPTVPNLSASTKTAPAQLVAGNNITYTINIINTGGGPANGAVMTDPIPAGTTYNNDVTCSSGTCGFDGANVTWNGVVAAGATVVVQFSVSTAGAPCDATVVNTATINAPITGPVTRSASTLLTGAVMDLVTEGFETAVPPPGWTETIVNDPGTDPDWSRVNAGTYPTINPHSGAYMAKFNSYDAPANASARLATYALNFSAVSTPRVAFYMSHDAFYSPYADRVQVQVSTNGGATWTDVGASVLRYDAAYTTPGWGYHTVNLTGYGGKPSVMIGFLGIGDFGHNFYLDDVAIQYSCGHPIVQVWPDQTGQACRGASASYTLNVKNVNQVADTIDLTVGGNAWPTGVAPTSLSLGPNETGQVVVTVDVPWTALPGDDDTATVTATAQGTGETDSADLTTTATVDSMADVMQNMATGAPTPLYWGGSYYENGHVCVVGGLSGSGSSVVSGAHQCYDIATAIWFNRAAMPTPRFGTAYGLIGNKFYMAGGFDADFTGYNTLQIYDIASDTWSTGAALPTARGGQAGGVVNGKLYSAGGTGTSSFPTDCPTYEYNPASNAWTSKAACPLQDGYGFDLGGSVGSDYWGRLFAGGHYGAYYGWYAYNPVGNTWTTLANLPFYKTPLIVENPNTGDIYSIGGLIGWTGQNQIRKYDYTTNAWTDTGVRLLTAQGGSLGPAHGSFGDPNLKGFWTFGGTAGSGSISPAPFELWEYVQCPACNNYIWDGGAGTSNWDTPVNWNPDGIPTINDNATIPTTPAVNVVWPTLNVNAAVHNLTLDPGAQLSIPSGLDLQVEGSVDNHGKLRLQRNVTGPTAFHLFNSSAAPVYYGVEITPVGDPLGMTWVEIRGHTECTTQDPTDTVNRCYEITPASVQTSNIRFYYLDSELDGLNPAQMQVWHWGGGLPWTAAGASTPGGSVPNYYVDVTGVTDYSPFTLTSLVGGPTAITLRALAGRPTVSVGWLLCLGMIVAVLWSRRRR